MTWMWRRLGLAAAVDGTPSPNAPAASLAWAGLVAPLLNGNHLRDKPTVDGL